MVNERIGIGDRFQQKRKYHRKKMAGGFLDWRKKTEEFKEYPGNIPYIMSIKVAENPSGRSWWGGDVRQGFLPKDISLRNFLS